MKFNKEDYVRLKKLFGFELAVAKQNKSAIKTREDEYASLLLHELDKDLTTIINSYSERIDNDLTMLTSLVALLAGTMGLVIGFIERTHSRETADNAKIFCEKRLAEYRRIYLGDKNGKN